ncbi:hypothetical protein SAMN05660862_2545 [Sphingobacterium psychroaquaticum]|uniref:Uncharacterized protein n=1 Tax=Sphingobacterium psychroaquaticum TaxID=561061 RepID=A0A1X7K462_9SPHI|nr:hypothetical protein SAMN05660862_2545 [Sphingobacterium psychroaquaticum]
MRIGFINYWKRDRFVFMPVVAIAFSPHKVELMILGIGLRIWK